MTKYRFTYKPMALPGESLTAWLDGPPSIIVYETDRERAWEKAKAIWQDSSDRLVLKSIEEVEEATQANRCNFRWMSLGRKRECDRPSDRTHGEYHTAGSSWVHINAEHTVSRW